MRIEQRKSHRRQVRPVFTDNTFEAWKQAPKANGDRQILFERENRNSHCPTSVKTLARRPCSTWLRISNIAKPNWFSAG
jgi:hypothetical protein